MIIYMTRSSKSPSSWRNPNLSSRVRVALYLFSEVGEGGRFFKSDMRAALPGKDLGKMIKEVNDISGSISKSGKPDDPVCTLSAPSAVFNAC